MDGPARERRLPMKGADPPAGCAGEGASEAWQQRAVRESMLGRWGTPEDIAAAVHWLVSPRAAFVTGQVNNINGGFKPA